MTMRPGTLVAAILVVVVGFAIGGWLAIRARAPAQQTVRTITTQTTGAAPQTPLATATARATPAPLVTRTPPTPAPVVASAQPVPTQPVVSAEPVLTRRVIPTAAPSAAPTAAVGNTALQGSWQLDEANVQVGTIVWAGGVTPHGTTIDLDVRKQSVAGRAAVPCERQTGLHASFSAGVAEQTVPFREVNCNGVVSTGEVHVTSFAANGGAFSGSFSSNGVNLGTFSAHKL